MSRDDTVEPQLLRQTAPSDPYYADQWQLHGQYGINVEAAWADYSGTGVVVAVFDDGIDWSHPDLDGNVHIEHSIAVDPGGAGGLPVHQADNHGTAVAGLIAAERDGVGSVGVAYDATLISMWQDFEIIGAGGIAAGFAHAAQYADILNNSWGFAFPFADNFEGDFAAEGAALADAVSTGRDGLGLIVVQAAGNAGHQSNANSHDFTANRFTISVGAVTSGGFTAEFSTPGASLLVSGPGSLNILTTDRTGNLGYDSGDYTETFGGTSAAAPLVSGVVALMLEGNPDLGWRDVQEILAASALRIGVPPGRFDYRTNGADDWNGGGMRFSDGLGAGIVDALAAVRLAETWTTTHVSANEHSVGGTAPGGFLNFGTHWVNRTISISEAIDVEHVELRLQNESHSYPADLTVTLQSPSGMTSTLAIGGYVGDQWSTFVFDSVQFWGEQGQGDWIISISDSFQLDSGSIGEISLSLFGAPDAPDDTYIYTNDFSEIETQNPARRTLVDSEGNDTINVAAVSASSTIDLSGGASTIDGQAVSIAANAIENVFAGDNADRLRGSATANTLWGGRGDDTLDGGGADDVLRGGRGNDHVTGGAGQDLADYSDALYGAHVDLAAGTARTGAGNLDHLFEIENVRGGDGNDALFASADANTLWGRGGADRFALLGDGDVAYGGDGIDVADFAHLVGGVIVDLADSIASGLHEIEDVVGGLGDDLITGDDRDNRIVGNDGNDTLYGAGGRDLLDYATVDTGIVVRLDSGTASGDGEDSLSGFEDVYGGSGNDTLIGDGANNLLAPRAGNDLVDGGGGRDTAVFALEATMVVAMLGIGYAWGQGFDALVSIEDMIGSDASDILTGSAQDNQLHGGAGDDLLAAGAGNDTAYGGAGEDLLDGQSGTDALYGGDQDDWLAGGADADRLDAGAGNDFADGGSGNDVVYGGAGADLILGGSGNDMLAGDDANDVLHGQDGDDTLIGGDGNDTVTGNAGNDLAYGGAGDDLLDGGGDTDRLYGAVGDDSLEGSSGDDFLWGGGGDDTASGNWDTDFIDGHAGSDLLYGGHGDDAIAAGPGSDRAFGGDADDSINGGSGDDALAGDSGDDTLAAGADNDHLTGGAGNDAVDGEQGDDWLFGGGGTDVLTGGAGIDAFMVESAATVTDFEAGSDAINLWQLGYRSLWALLGAGGSLTSANGHSVLATATGATITIAGSHALTASDFDYSPAAPSSGTPANVHNGTYSGTNGDDTIVASAGHDTLIGGWADDTLVGGEGNDFFHVSNGRHVAFGGVGDDALLGWGPHTFWAGTGTDTLHLPGEADLLVDMADGTARTGNGTDVLVFSSVEVLTVSPYSPVPFGSIFGSAGNDTIEATGMIDGRAGDDVIRFIPQWFAASTLFGGDGLDTLQIGNNDLVVDVWLGQVLGDESRPPSNFDGFEVFEPVNGAFVSFIGSAGDDVFRAINGRIFAFGANGADTFIGGITGASGEGNDTFLGGSGDDVVDYRFLEAFDDVVTDDYLITVRSAHTGYDTFQSVETWNLFASFTDGDDIFFGAAWTHTLWGGAGNDAIAGGEADDYLFGGAGDDTLTGAGGGGVLDGGEGNDVLAHGTFGSGVRYICGIGIDTIERFETGYDRLDLSLLGYSSYAGFIADGGRIVETGFTSLDIVGPQGLIVRLTSYVRRRDFDPEVDIWFSVAEPIYHSGHGEGHGRDAADTMIGTDVLDWRIGWDGPDTIYGEGAVDILKGEAGDDLLFGGGDDDQMRGGDGDDVAYGGDGDDSFDGGTGNDTFWGGAGGTPRNLSHNALQFEGALEGVLVDLVLGIVSGGPSTGTDQFYSVAEVQGSRFNDTIYGDADSNYLHGGRGDDFVVGRGGHDGLFGGHGADTLVGEGDGGGLIDGGEGNDLLIGGADRHAIEGGSGDDIAFGGDAGGEWSGQQGDDTFFGGAGGDVIYIRDSAIGGMDTVYGGSGEDYLIVGTMPAGTTLVVDYEADYVLVTTSWGASTEVFLFDVEGLPWNVGPAAATSLFGTSGDDELYVRGLAVGRGGDDTLVGSEEFDNTLYGGPGDDTLYAAGANSDDRLIGGPGNDELNLSWGDVGVVQPNGGVDTIPFWFDGLHRIEVAGFGWSTFADFLAGGGAIHDPGPANATRVVTVTFDPQTSLIISLVAETWTEFPAIDASDFIFV